MTNPDSEWLTLCLMIDSPRESVEKVMEAGGTELFEEPAHRGAAKVIIELFGEIGAVTQTELVNRLQATPGYEEIAEKIAERPESVPAESAVLQEQINFLSTRKVREELRGIGEELFRRSNDHGDSVEQILKDTEFRLLVVNAYPSRETRTIREGVMEAIEQIEEAFNDRHSVTGTATGFVDLDKLTRGFHAGEFVVIAGDQGAGKTTLATNLVARAALNEKNPQPVGWCTFQESAPQAVVRMMARLSELPYSGIVYGKLREKKDLPNLMKAAQSIVKSSIRIDDRPGIDMAALWGLARHWKIQSAIRMLVIDSLDQLDAKGSEGARLKEIGRTLKTIARKFQIPVVLMANTTDHPHDPAQPQLRELRSLWPVVLQADQVIWMREGQAATELHVLRQRHGPRGMVRLTHIREQMRFENWTEQKAPPDEDEVEADAFDPMALAEDFVNQQEERGS